MRYWEKLQKRQMQETRAAKRRQRETFRPSVRASGLSWVDRFIQLSLAMMALLTIVAIVLWHFAVVKALHIVMGIMSCTLFLFIFAVVFNGHAIRASLRKNVVSQDNSSLWEVNHASK